MVKWLSNQKTNISSHQWWGMMCDVTDMWFHSKHDSMGMRFYWCSAWEVAVNCITSPYIQDHCALNVHSMSSALLNSYVTSGTSSLTFWTMLQWIFDNCFDIIYKSINIERFQY